MASAHDTRFDSFVCPISFDIMQDPVICVDGHSYDRKNIEAWLKLNNSSPLTGEELSSRTLTPNITLKKSIEEWKSMQVAAPPPPPSSFVIPWEDIKILKQSTGGKKKRKFKLGKGQ